ncbi:LysE family translocator [Loktanella salsilacus]|jgi:threonine/homoserine/homoserine lactone efflux protein|uniref:Threonine/homoserine/homoserine lactone efflux protein n=2 Tax=Loktanella salsilacus TaxID=195913 RepID=A0A1I4BN04_9RHOB|nr:LysE family transporter [Loktanella salsilacus]MBU0862365.1 LysE family translocator [Alphaproteobacteria bacterium]UTH45588.1 LysE family transporter [Loktanella salsilacus]UTH49362.1 LysE family transporter [Loktanella salsilacus]SFK69577.1 Threonine/homoserine/homoserine lactone efflux protein [Loktanella salsilacus]
MTLAAFASIVLIHLAAAISPGPSFVVALRVAAAEGFRVAAALALGFGLGAVLWAGAAMAGLALVFSVLPALFLALKFVGAAFLIYLAVQMWRHAATPMPAPQTDTPPRSAFAAVRFGFVTFASNPKPAIFFGAVFVNLVPAATPLGWKAAILLAVLLNETLWYLIVARVFSLPRPRAAYARAKAWIDRGFGTLLALLGLKIALT